MGISNLPSGWTKTTIGEIVSFEYGKGLKESIRDQSGDVPVYGSNGIVGKHSKALVDKPCLIVGRKGTAGAVHISKTPCWAIDTTYFVLPPENVSLSFLYYLLSSVNLSSLDKSTAIPGLNRNDAYKVEIPLPPLPEQERIVAKIEELFTQLDAGMGALKGVQAGLKRYKASMLKMAVSGRLVNGDLEIGEGELPEGWQLVKFGDIITVLKNGFFYGRPSTEPIGIPILRISAVRPMLVNFDEPRYIPDVNEKDVKDYFLAKGDLLFTRYNGNKELVGACGLVGGLHQNVLYPDKLIRVRVNEQVVSPGYTEVYFATQTARHHIENRIKSTAGQHGIAGGDVRSIPFILPPLAEQQRIVAEVERRLSVVKEVESVVATSAARAGRLRQAVLNAAFEGRL